MSDALGKRQERYSTIINKTAYKLSMTPSSMAGGYCFNSFICETKILKVKRIKISKSNNPAKGGGLNTPQFALGFHTRDFPNDNISQFFLRHIVQIN
jgi:hypothetical protein